jgi:hypothetical protein
MEELGEGVGQVLTARICPSAVSMLSPPKRVPISRLSGCERWRIQIARLCSAGLAPAAKAETLVTAEKIRGDEETCNATRECDIMSRRREPRVIQRSNVIERARCAGATPDGGSETDTGDDGLKVDIRTSEVD